MKHLFLAFLLIIVDNTGHAITTEYFNTELKERQRNAYMFGALEMAISMYSSDNRTDEAACVRNWIASNPENSMYPAAGIFRVVIASCISRDLI